MITGVIKNKIDKIWTDIWAGGLTMPFKVIEQITYLMFIRSLDGFQHQGCPDQCYLYRQYAFPEGICDGTNPQEAEEEPGRTS